MLLWLTLDQGTKYAVFGLLASPDKPETYPILPGVLHITPAKNPGVAFGLRLLPRPLVLAASMGAAAMMCWIYWRNRATVSMAQIWALALLIAGAVGNAADRLFVGEVLDFIDIRIWPVFNAADIYICVGVALYLLSELLPAARGWSSDGRGEAPASEEKDACRQDVPGGDGGRK